LPLRRSTLFIAILLSLPLATVLSQKDPFTRWHGETLLAHSLLSEPAAFSRVLWTTLQALPSAFPGPNTVACLALAALGVVCRPPALSPFSMLLRRCCCFICLLTLIAIPALGVHTWFACDYAPGFWRYRYLIACWPALGALAALGLCRLPPRLAAGMLVVIPVAGIATGIGELHFQFRPWSHYPAANYTIVGQEIATRVTPANVGHWRQCLTQFSPVGQRELAAGIGITAVSPHFLPQWELYSSLAAPPWQAAFYESAGYWYAYHYPAADTAAFLHSSVPAAWHDTFHHGFRRFRGTDDWWTDYNRARGRLM